MARKPISKRLRYKILFRDGHTCQYCGKSAPDAELQIDHIIPVAHGGTNDENNLLAACFDCNLGKRTDAAGKGAYWPQHIVLWVYRNAIICRDLGVAYEDAVAEVLEYTKVWDCANAIAGLAAMAEWDMRAAYREPGLTGGCC